VRYFIYWKHQTPGTPPVATIDAASAEAAMKQFKRESPYPIRADQMSVETTQR
jgi:hypothetical protein